MKKILFMVLVAGSCGCGMLRKVEKASAESSTEQHLAITRDSLHLETQHSRKILLKQQSDSSATGYVMEIWPKGKFSISPMGKFEGEATKIRLQGQMVATKKSFQLGQQVKAISSLKSLNTKMNLQNKAKQKQVLLKRNPAWKWALLLLACAIGIYTAITMWRKTGLPGQRLL